MKGLKRVDMTELLATLTDQQREPLEMLSGQMGFPPTGWTAVPGLLLVAQTMATTNVARAISRQQPDWSEARCLDEAEPQLLADGAADALASRPKSVRTNLARWRLDIRPD